MYFKIMFFSCFSAQLMKLFVKLFVLEIATGIYTYHNEDEVLDLFKKNIKDAVKNSYGQSCTANKASTKDADWFQRNVREYTNIYLV